jgi:hypothetical protein
VWGSRIADIPVTGRLGRMRSVTDDAIMDLQALAAWVAAS